MPEESDDAVAYFAERGYEVEVEQRDLHAEHMAAGEPGRASFFAEGRQYYCVNLIREGMVVTRRFADGETTEDALASARRRYGSEQA